MRERSAVPASRIGPELRAGQTHRPLIVVGEGPWVLTLSEIGPPPPIPSWWPKGRHPRLTPVSTPPGVHGGPSPAMTLRGWCRLKLAPMGEGRPSMPFSEPALQVVDARPSAMDAKIVKRAALCPPRHGGRRATIHACFSTGTSSRGWSAFADHDDETLVPPYFGACERSPTVTRAATIAAIRTPKGRVTTRTSKRPSGRTKFHQGPRS
jgi:hypothetical protein